MNDDKPEEQNLEVPARSERVFDISSDLNIKELKEEIANEPPPPAIKIFSQIKRPQAPIPASPVSKPAIPVPRTIAPTNAAPTVPSIKLSEAAPRNTSPIPRPSINVLEGLPKIRPIETGSTLPKSTSAVPVAPTPLARPGGQFVPTAVPRTILPTAPTGVPTPRPAPKIAPAVPPVSPGPTSLQEKISTMVPSSIPAQKVPPTPTIDQKPPVILPRPQYTTSVTSEPPSAASSILKKLRTYEGDVAEALSHRGTSALNMTIAENKRRQGEERISNQEKPDDGSGHSLRKTLAILLSIILILAGVGGGYYLYSQSPLGTANQQPVETPKAKIPRSLVPSDAQTIISIDGLSAPAVLSALGSEIATPQEPDSIREIILTQTSETVQVRATVQTMTGLLGVPVPDIILRTIAPQWMLGIYTNADGSNSIFVVTKTDLFQNAFAGMLRWESFMGLSLSRIAPTVEERGQFRDKIVKNKDVRAFVGESGREEFVYSFIDNATLVIAQDAETVSAIISRLENSAFIR